MTQDEFDKAKELRESIGATKDQILRIEILMKACSKQKRPFALRDTADLNSPIIHISQEEALPFFEKKLEGYRRGLEKLEKEFDEL